MISARFLASQPHRGCIKQRYTRHLLTFQGGKRSGQACVTLKCLGANLDLVASLVCSQKLKSGPYLIFVSFIYVFSAFLHFKPVYIELACFSVRNCLRWGWEIGLFQNPTHIIWWFPVPSWTRWVWGTGWRQGDCLGQLWSSGRLRVAPGVENTEDYCLNLHLVPGCQGLRPRPSREHLEQRKLKGWEEGLMERAEHHPQYPVLPTGADATGGWWSFHQPACRNLLDLVSEEALCLCFWLEIKQRQCYSCREEAEF